MAWRGVWRGVVQAAWQGEAWQGYAAPGPAPLMLGCSLDSFEQLGALLGVADVEGLHGGGQVDGLQEGLG